MAQHWLRSPNARDLPLSAVLRMSEDEAYAWFYRARWGDADPVCPFCGVLDSYHLTRNGQRANRFRCRDAECRREFTVTSQTIFSARKLPFRKMLAVMALWVHSVKGKAALQVCREVGITYRSAWVLQMKLREAMAAAQPDEPLDGVVEIDGAYVGGFQRPENRRQDRADARLVEYANPAGRQVLTALRQRPLLGLPDRVFTTITPGEVVEYAEDIVLRKVTRRAVILSDEHRAYRHLADLNPMAFRIRHADAYAMGPGLNTNHVESFFGRVRRSVAGIHHRVCGRYLELYASSLAWHENTRRQRFSEKLGAVLEAGLRHPVSRKFCGYWQGVYPVEPLGWELPPREP